MKFSFGTFALPWLLAPLLPVLVAYSSTPDLSLYNRLAALLGWGGILIWAGGAQGRQAGARTIGVAVAALLGGALLVEDARLFIPLMGLLCGLLGWGMGRRGAWEPAANGVFSGYALAAVLGKVVCMLQFFAPGWGEGWWIAASATAGRAAGNLRQPNLQATMLIWGVMAAAWLAAGRPWLRIPVALRACGAVFAVALTGSRPGMALTGLLLLWGLADRSLPRALRGMLVATPLLLWLSIQAVSSWAHLSGSSYFVETRAQSGSDISSSRFAIWANTWELIRAHPWAGVGWGDFNFAWTLTEFGRRPVAFFDHTHNLPLQLAVELGIPAAAGLCGGFLWLTWHARGALSLPDALSARTARAGLAMLAAVLFHSLLEYPLWYPYFLLPAAFIWGLYLGLGWPKPRAGEAELDAAGGKRTALQSVLGPTLLAAGVMTLVSSSYALWDYQRITQIFAPRGVAGARPLIERIHEGQRSRLFGAHADYAAVTTAARPSEVFEAFVRPLHRLFDARLIIAYARALVERGERDKAVYVAQRLREFRHPLGDKFFAVCEAQRLPGEPVPFQCEREPVRLTFRAFQAPGR